MSTIELRTVRGGIAAFALPLLVLTAACGAATTGGSPADSCASNTDCAAGQLCVSGQCVAGGALPAGAECSPTVACPDSKTCVGGKCVITCNSALPCPAGLNCIGGTCQAGAPATNTGVSQPGADAGTGEGLEGFEGAEGLPEGGEGTPLPEGIEGESGEGPEGGAEGAEGSGEGEEGAAEGNEGAEGQEGSGEGAEGDEGSEGDAGMADDDGGTPDSGIPPVVDDPEKLKCDEFCFLELPNADAICVDSKCEVALCAENYQNLNKLVTDGCEYFCVPDGAPSEGCDGKDNDCDGLVDEDKVTGSVLNCGKCGQICPTPPNAAPVCPGEVCGFTCLPDFFDNDGDPSNGCEAQACKPTNGGVEVCDGADNDCDNQIDEGFPRDKVDSCGASCQDCTKLFAKNHEPACELEKCVDKGCKKGFVDADGDPGNGCEYACFPTPNPTEMCDGVDNDCNPATADGSQDPGVGQDCTINGKHGICAPGKKECKAGLLACIGNIQPQPETCDGTDQDCDGALDNGQTCPTGQSCVGGACVAGCVDECPATGVKECLTETTLRTCGQSDPDACLDWGPATNCGAFESCTEGGICALTCQNECPSEGAKQCVDGKKFAICSATADPDPCLEWGPAQTCPGTDKCTGAGSCVCTDECATGASECQSNTLRQCKADGDADACLEMKAVQDCAATGYSCQVQGGTAQCVPPPPSCDPGWSMYPAEKTCFKKYTSGNPVNFFDAETQCFTDSGYGAIVKSANENSTVTSVCGGTDCWLGGSICDLPTPIDGQATDCYGSGAKKDSDWFWVPPNLIQDYFGSGYKNWDSGQPDTGSSIKPRLCLRMIGNGKWHAHYCDGKASSTGVKVDIKAYVCERPARCGGGPCP